MGIGRRKFLEFVGIALAGVAQNSANSVVVNSDYYVNMKLGLGFRKPSSWYFDSFKDFSYLKSGQQLSKFDVLTQRELQGMFADPIAVLSKYPIGPSDPKFFSPSVAIYYGDNEELLLHDGFADYVQAALEGWKAIFTDFELVEPPTEMMISNCDAMRFKAKFLFEHEDICPTPVNVESLVVLQEAGQYTIHLFDSPRTGEIAEEEFSIFIDALHVV